ncbi:MAG: sporulation peptidase YabG [Clostridia bacterium]
MQAGANFASSPARILIDILDPLIVAKEVAITDDCKYVKIEDIENKLRDGKRGIGGTGARRKKKEKYITKYRKCRKCVFYICL